MSNIKFSEFADGGELKSTDELVGLRNGVNTKFNSGLDPGGPYLLKANNLADVSNKMDSFQNLGFGSGQLVFLTEADFPGNIHTLTNPCPNYIQIQITTPGTYILKLPPATGTTAFQISQGPIIRVSPDISISSGVVINLQDSIGDALGAVGTPAGVHAYLSSNATPQGTWVLIPNVFSISTNNSDSGDLTLRNSFENVYVDALYGENILNFGQGSIFQPYRSLNFALTQITDASSSKPYKIIMNTGVYTDTNLVLKPWIYIQGNNSTLTVSGSVTLDASWSSGGYLYFQDFFNLAWPATVTLDFNAVSASFALFNLSNNIYNSNTTLNVIGDHTNGAITIIENNFGFSNEWAYNITNCYGAISGGASGDISIINTSNTAGGNFSVLDMTGIANFTATTSSTSGMTLFHSGSLVSNQALYKSTGPGVLTVFARGLKYDNTPTLDNGSGGGSVNYSADTLDALPTLLNGATYTPTSIGDAVRANRYFTPVNYVPVSGGPGLWVADSATGNFKGIDNALGSVTGVVYQQLYVNNTFGNDSNTGSILAPLKTYEAARLKAVSLGASITNRFQISIVGSLTIGGNLTLTPFISVVGLNDYQTPINISGNVQLDAAWGTTVTPFMMVRNLNLFGSGHINLVYPSFQAGSFIRFQDCSIQFSSNTITGAGTNTACENVIFNNCNNDSNTLFPESTYTATNVNIAFFNTNPANTITISVTSATSLATAYITGSQTITGNITLNAAAAGTLTTYIGSSFTKGRTLTINGASNTVNVDSTSYQFTLALSGGASLSNLVLPTKTDGLVNTTYSPVNYVPAAGTLFSANTLTGNLKGIDNFLGKSNSEVIFVDGINGSNSNTGSINSPLQTYEAARLLAVSRNPQYGTAQVIVLLTGLSITGDMTISPYVNIIGYGAYSTIVGATGNLVLGAGWGTTNIPFVQIIGIGFVVNDINFTFPSFKDHAFIRFQQCSLQLLNGAHSATITGSDASGDTRCETVIFDTCNLDLYPGELEPAYTLVNVNAYFWNTNISNSVTATVTSATVHASLLIQNTPSVAGNITLNAASAGTLTTKISSTNTSGSTLTINGTSNTASVDESSYQFTLALSGGATLSNINIPSMGEGVNVNTNFTPTAYTPTAGTLYKSNSLIGNLAGIDARLSSNVVKWQVVTTNQSMVSGNGYIANNAGLLTFTLPSSLTAGQVFAVAGFGAGGWTIAQQSGQSIALVNGTSTTTGVGGSLASDAAFPRSSCYLVVVNSTTLIAINVNGIIDAT